MIDSNERNVRWLDGGGIVVGYANDFEVVGRPYTSSTMTAVN